MLVDTADGEGDGPAGEYVAVVDLQQGVDGVDKPHRPRRPPLRHSSSKAGRMGQELDLTVHTRTAYHIAFVGVVCYFVNLILEDIKRDGSATLLRWELLGPSFSPSVLLQLTALWLLVNAFLLANNLGVRCWRAGRELYVKRAVWDTLWLLAALVLHAAMVVVPAAGMHLLDLPTWARCALCCEQLRLIMKSYSYLREHARTVLSVPARPAARARHSARADGADLSVGHLVYFMFAPTLLYRDSYERCPRVRPLAVLVHAGVFFASVFTMVVVCARSSLRPLCGGEDAPLLALWTALGAPRFPLVVIRSYPVAAVMLAGITTAMHHWHRLFAELLRFRQRGFTKEWLNKYVYKEMRAHGYNIFLAKIFTIVVSAVWHEYILANCFGFLVPFFFFLYTLSTAFVLTEPFGLQKGNYGNLFFLATIPLGLALAQSFYFMEVYARLQCPVVDERPWDIFVPRQWLCDDPFRNCTFI
ncbi:Sterol O-acyltransferase 2 [Frankliniella fusca]|uniref:O-acyltransferase n=1 Tax=Frankliniella fusca TaxID=407009 RepID=A0AAE1GYP0_9NEOP|nr:Sterol O-acyltransferase 2 [Frankliniella fusca]